MSHLFPDPLNSPLTLQGVLSDLAAVLSEQLQARSLMAQTVCLVGETIMGHPIEHKMALQPPLWGEESVRAALLDLMSSGRFPAPLAHLSVILTDLVLAQVEQLPLFTPIVVTPPMMPPILRTRYARHTYQAQLIAPKHPLPEQRFVWHAAAV